MLNKKIEKIKNKYYDKRNVTEYLKKSSEDIILPKKIIEFCEKENIVIKENDYMVFPSKTWYFKFPQYKIGEFEAKFGVELILSKLTELYAFTNSFDVVNKVENYMDPSLYGTSEQTYILLQQQLMDLVEAEMNLINFERIYAREYDRKIEGVNFVDGVTIFGEDVTVYDLLFRDVLDVTPED